MLEPAASGAVLPTGAAVEREELARAATSQPPLMDSASTRLLAPGDTKEPEEDDDGEYRDTGVNSNSNLYNPRWHRSQCCGNTGVPVASLATALEPEPPAAAGVSVAAGRGRSDAREVERNRYSARLAARLAALGQ
jgi:hypothetical protein